MAELLRREGSGLGSKSSGCRQFYWISANSKLFPTRGFPPFYPPPAGGFHNTNKQRRWFWFFGAFSGSVGESGDRMIHEFRMANSMTRKQFNYLFIHRSELVQNKIGPADTV